MPIPGRIAAKIANRLQLASNRAALVLEKLRGVLSIGFVPPPYDGMQNYARMKFLYDSVRMHAPRSGGVALEVGCYNAGSTVFLAKAALRVGIVRTFAMDLFTGTPSWNQSIDTYATAAARIAAYKLTPNVTLIRSHSLQYDWTEKIAVLHLDADHEYQAVAADLKDRKSTR